MKPVDQSEQHTPELCARGWHPQTFAKDQPQYTPLPVLVNTQDPERTVLSRWRFTAEELAALMAGEDLYLEQMTFGSPLQPVRLTVGAPPWVFGETDQGART